MTRQEIINTFILSIERERTSLGLTQAKMAQKLDMSASGYKKMIAGETTKVDLYIAYQMHELTGKWLFEPCCDDSLQTQIISRLNSLNDSQLRFIKEIADIELAFLEKRDKEDIKDYVNLLTLTGSHEDGMIWDSYNIEKINIASYRKRFGDELHCALKINNNSLHPVYQAGDILLVSQTSPRDGDTGIFINRETGRTYLRRMRYSDCCHLEPLNNLGATFTINRRDKTDLDKWIEFGRVLSKMR